MNLCYKALNISSTQAEQLYKDHLLLKPEQRATYSKVLQKAGEKALSKLNESGKSNSKGKSDKSLSAEQTREALLYMTEVRAETVRTKDAMVKSYKENEKKDGEATLQYLDQILKERAYDLLALEKQIEKSDLMAAILKHGDKDAIKDLMSQVQQK